MYDIFYSIIIIIFILFTPIIVVITTSNKKLKNELLLANKINSDLTNNYEKLLNQKKSSEVKLGKIGENMAPFFCAWPYDPNRFRFIGDPIDGIQFCDDEVVLVEIKTGKARLTQGQRRVKELVKEGKVKFATFRVGEEGCNFKLEENK